MTSTILTVSQLHHLSALAVAVQAGQPITWLSEDGATRWGIARAFTHADGAGFLTDADDVRDGFVWFSGGSSFTERWVPVSELVTGLLDGSVALDYRPV